MDYIVHTLNSRDVKNEYPAVVIGISETGSCVYGPFKTLEEAAKFARAIPEGIYDVISVSYIVDPKETVMGDN